MGIILETIHNLLLALQEPISGLVTMFPGTLLTFTLTSIIIRKKIGDFLYVFKK